MAFIGSDIPWADPILYATAVAALPGDMAFLHSSLETGYSGRYSLLAWDAREVYQGKDFSIIPASHAVPLFGYFGYELGATLESMPPTRESPIVLPNLHFVDFGNILRFDHHNKIIETWGAQKPQIEPKPEPFKLTPAPHISELGSSMSKETYLGAVQEALDGIGAGNFYQVNLTRKFFGHFDQPVKPFDLYQRLIGASPAPYSAFMRLGDASILSSSPELFLKIEDGHIISRPIKGTAPRWPDHEKDAAQKAALAKSAKDQAENLMIVDLMRHDLSRVCIPGSVDASDIFAVDSFPTVHHLSSTVHGTLAPDKNSLDALKAAFPPGSMTGAPKIAAMRWLANKEAVKRGIYSGALGWLTQNEAELSVVIRTLIVKNDQFEFQVGGGIVADSTPEAEWQETIYKAEGILQGLGLNAAAIRAI